MPKVFLPVLTALALFAGSAAADSYPDWPDAGPPKTIQAAGPGPARSLLLSAPDIPGAQRLIGPGGPFERRYESLLAQDEGLHEAVASFREAVLSVNPDRLTPLQAARLSAAVNVRAAQLRLLERRHLGEVRSFVWMLERPSKGDGMVRIDWRYGVSRY